MTTDSVLNNDFIHFLEKIKQYHCTFSVYVQYIRNLIKRHNSVHIGNDIYSDIIILVNDLLDEVDELEDLMNDQMVESKHNIQEYIDTVTVIEYLNDLTEFGSAFVTTMNGCME
jgi:hypothetical protein